MAEKLPSAKKKAAEAAQSAADRTGTNKEQARRLQSEADRSDVPKHGL